MRNRICFLLTIVISLFICDKVSAEKLICVYNYSGLKSSDYKFIQDVDGSWTVQQIYNTDEPKASASTWIPFENYEVYLGTNYENFYISESNTVTRCPNYVDVDLKSTGKHQFVLHDKQKYNVFGSPQYAPLFEVVEPTDDYPNVPDNTDTFYYEYNDDYWKIVNETEWKAECSYYDQGNDNTVHLYFNDERYILINEASSTTSNIVKFTIDELNEYFETLYNSCPPRLFVTLNYCNTVQYDNFTKSYYLTNSGFVINECSANEITNTVNNVNVPKPEPEPPKVINDCNDLLGPSLVEDINSVMNIFKIVVPILLIAFGIIDFSKCVFLSDTNEMTKVYKKFFRRIIAAVIAFLSPVFVNLILTIANEVWSYINPETCIK